MVFSSLEFIFVFLSIFLLIYYLVPSKYKNHILLLGSIIFYSVGSYGHIEYIILIVLSIIINYILGRVIGNKKSKRFLLLGLIYNIFWLLLFKYYDFLVSTVFDVTEIQLNQLNLLLPIGISFYTFKSISYIVDVYNGKCEAETNILKFATYIIMFPQLMAGPIDTYGERKSEIENRSVDEERIMQGCKYFILGLGLKVLLANKVGILWSDVQTIGIESVSSILLWLGVIAYSLQIYFDFYGYSLMAIGVGKLIGFNLPENFNTPYLSLSMTEFFRRWHITLGRWFKNYVYIPLGGNRKGKVRLILNLLVVWVLTGLWHGANYNFILWGLGIFAFIVIEKLFLKEKLDKYPIIGHLYMIILIPLMWLVFAITDVHQIGVALQRMFIYKHGINQHDFMQYIIDYGILIVISVICCTRLLEKVFLKKETRVIEFVLLLVMFWGSVYCLSIGLDNPFIYFRF